MQKNVNFAGSPQKTPVYAGNIEHHNVPVRFAVSCEKAAFFSSKGIYW